MYPGVLAAKVSDFGSNLLKWARAQMATKPAKVGHSAPGAILYYRPYRVTVPYAI